MLQASSDVRRCRIARLTLTASLLFLVPVPMWPASATSPAEALEQAQRLIQQGNLTAARNVLTRALKEFPKEVGFYNLLGVVEAQEGNYGAAEANFKKAIAGTPRFTGAYLNLGRLYQEHAAKDPGALKKGLDTYAKLLSYEPDNVEANYQSAYLLNVLGSYQSSLNRLARLPPEAQQRPQALAIRCADYAGLGEPSRAEEAAAALARSPELNEEDVLTIFPVLDKHRGEHLKLRLLTALADRGLATARSLVLMGVLYEKRGEYPRAREALEKAGQQDPNSVPLLLELARVADKQGDNKGALGYLAHARDLEPNNPAIHFFFGIVCVKENLVEEAYRSLKKAVTLNPQNAYYNYAFGAVTVQRQDASESLPYFKKYVELKPDDPRGRFALGAAYFYGHDSELARRELEGAAKRSETAAGAHYFLGRVANQQGRFEDAVRELHQALAADPNFADAYAELGLLHLKQKQYAEAEKALLRALELNPESYTANLNLMILYQRTKNPRADAQAKRFEEIRVKRTERSKEFLRTIVVQP